MFCFSFCGGFCRCAWGLPGDQFGGGHHLFDAHVPTRTRFVNETACGGGSWCKFSIVWFGDAVVMGYIQCGRMEIKLGQML